MKVLKIKAFQETCNYKKPFMQQINETYPLPPYSTINGWLHAILEANEYIDLNISVQGSYETLFSYKQIMRFYKKNTNTTKPVERHELYNVNLIIHIAAENDVIDKIYNNILTHGYPTLGRNEDLIRIDDIKFVFLSEYEVDLMKYELGFTENILKSYKIKNNIYINSTLKSENNMNNLDGIYYRLNTHYTNDASKSRRLWNTVNSLFVQAGEDIVSGKILLDDEGDIVEFYKELQ